MSSVVLVALAAWLGVAFVTFVTFVGGVALGVMLGAILVPGEGVRGEGVGESERERC